MGACLESGRCSPQERAKPTQGLATYRLSSFLHRTSMPEQPGAPPAVMGTAPRFVYADQAPAQSLHRFVSLAASWPILSLSRHQVCRCPHGCWSPVAVCVCGAAQTSGDGNNRDRERMIELVNQLFATDAHKDRVVPFRAVKVCCWHPCSLGVACVSLWLWLAGRAAALSRHPRLEAPVGASSYMYHA